MGDSCPVIVMMKPSAICILKFRETIIIVRVLYKAGVDTNVCDWRRFHAFLDQLDDLLAASFSPVVANSGVGSDCIKPELTTQSIHTSITYPRVQFWNQPAVSSQPMQPQPILCDKHQCRKVDEAPRSVPQSDSSFMCSHHSRQSNKTPLKHQNFINRYHSSASGRESACSFACACSA